MSRYLPYRQQTQFRIPRTMLAVTLSGAGLEKLACTEVPVPQVGPDQLLCRVDAAGVCTSILKLLAQGSAHTFLNGWDLAQHPIILGDEGSLTVAQVGRNLARNYQPGQRLGVQPAVDVAPINYRERYKDAARDMRKVAVGYTLGGNLAEYLLIQEEVLAAGCLLPLPDQNLPYFAVSMAEPISCVYSAQERHFHLFQESPLAPRQARLGLLRGGTTVVIGAGPMGLMHCELALRFGPANLIVCDRIQDRLVKASGILKEKARRAGVNVVTVGSEQLRQTLYDLTRGAMADDIILAVGIQAVQQQALELLGKGGVANLFGGLPRGQHTLQVNAIAVHYDEIKLVGSSGGAPYDLAATLDALATNQIDAGNYVFGVGSLRHAGEVLQGIKDSKIEGKVILYPHTRTDKLTFVDAWDAEQERVFLDQHLT